MRDNVEKVSADSKALSLGQFLLTLCSAIGPLFN